MNEFTSMQKKVCSYALNNHQKIPFITVEEYAHACGASPATVVRTIKALGYANYHEMQAEFEALLLGTRVSLWWELERSIDDNDDDFPLAWVAKDNIRAIQSSITPYMVERYHEAVDLLIGAKQIYILGMRSSMGAAVFFYSMMNQMLPGVRLGGGSEVIYDELVDLGPEDVLFAISLGGPHHAKATAKAMRFAAANAIPTLLIANTPASPSSDLASISLYVSSADKHYSIVPCMTLLESLIVSVGKKCREQAKKKLRKLEEVLVSEDITY